MVEGNVSVNIEYCELRKSSSEPDNRIFKKEASKNRLLEKIVHLVAVITIVCLTHAVVYEQWLIPFYYVIATPILITYRVITYWKCKYQYFLLDFCYFANIILFVYIWVPSSELLFYLVFGMANGPLIWAMFVYKNSIVFHSVDKLTSTYIHILPPLLAFVIRWYPEATLRHWVGDFVPPTDIDYKMVLGLIALPFVAFFIHSMLYYIIVQRLLKPSDDYLTSYGYLGLKEEACLTKLFHCCGKEYKCIMFYLFNWIFCLLTLTGILLWYNFFIAHCILIVFQLCAVLWNGASYYMHVFALRGFVDE